MRRIFALILCSSLWLFSPIELPGNQKEIWKVQSDYALKLFSEKKYEKALEIELSSLVLAEKTFGKTHPNTVSNLNNIGEIYRALNKMVKAELFFRRAVAIELGRKIKKKILVRYIANLARLIESLGRYEEAEKNQKTVIQYSEKFFGSDSMEFASSLARLGRIYRKLGKFNKAGEVLNRALRITRSKGDANSRQIVFIYSNLGMNYDESGDFEKAEHFLKKAVSVSKNALGENDPETARNINNLSALYFKFSKYREARELTEKFIELNRKQKNMNREMADMGISNLAAVFYAQKLYRNAEEKFLSLLKDQEKRYGKGHPSTASTIRKLGILYFSWRKYRKSMDFLERSFSIEPSPGGRGDQSWSEGRSTLGLVYEKLGMDWKAAELYRSSLRMSEEMSGGDPTRLISVLNDLGTFYFRRGRKGIILYGADGTAGPPVKIFPLAASLSDIRESGRILGRGMGIINRFPEKSYPVSLITVNYYMEYLLAAGKFAEAENLYAGIVEQYGAIYGRNHLNMCNVLGQYAEFCRKRGDLDKALKLSRDVVEIYRKNGLDADLKAVESLRNLGNILIQRHDYEEAEEIFIKKLRILETRFGPDSIEMVNDVFELGNLYLLNGDLKRGGDIFMRVLKIWDGNSGGGGSESVSFLKEISEKLLQCGYKKQWRKLNTRIRALLRKEERRNSANRQL